MFTFFGSAFLVLAAVCGVLWLRARALTTHRAASLVLMAGKPVELPTALWAVASTGVHNEVGQFLLGARVKTAQQLADGLNDLVEQMPEAQRAAIVAQSERMSRARAEYQLWSGQSEAITGAAAMGGLDGLILALGQDPEWLRAVLGNAAGNVDLSHDAIGAAVNSALQAGAKAMPDVTASLVDHLDQAVGPTLDHAGAQSPMRV